LTNRTIGETTSEAVNRLGRHFLRWLDGYFRRHSRVGADAFFDAALFPWIGEAEARWPTIRRELEAVLPDRESLPNFQDVVNREPHVAGDTGWKTCVFFAYGFEFARNMERCPETTRLVRRIPGVASAMFSILSPGRRIAPHRGPYAGVLRYHLALRVPEPAARCGIRVGKEVRHWEEGRSLVFDDVFEHEVWNDTEGTRVVLFVDFKRPLGGLAGKLNDLLVGLIGFSPHVRDGAARHKAWEERLERLRSGI
jgi:aspartyl/asparaginyl beta-hydroxylase (cupin superfamily)